MGIQISIVGGSNGVPSTANATGSDQHIITDKERGTFNVNDASLKAAVAKYFGKSPNDAYLHSPTPWNDLYKTYGWSQVKTVTVPIKAEILSLNSQPTVLEQRTFKNDSNVKGTFNTSISDEVSNTVETNWSTGGTLEISEAIEVGVNFIADAKSTTTLSYSQSWGVGGSKSQTTTIGTTTGVSVELDPGQSVIAMLSASKGTLKVRITYQSYLTGICAVNYNPTFKDHHFWALPIESIMASGGLSNKVVSTQDFELGYYSDGKVEIKNASGELLKAMNTADQKAA